MAYSEAGRVRRHRYGHRRGLNRVPRAPRKSGLTTNYAVGELLLAGLDQAASSILRWRRSRPRGWGASIAEALGTRLLDGAGDFCPLAAQPMGSTLRSSVSSAADCTRVTPPSRSRRSNRTIVANSIGMPIHCILIPEPMRSKSVSVATKRMKSPAEFHFPMMWVERRLAFTSSTGLH